jgi:predicted DNA-binding WGR domain protein
MNLLENVYAQLVKTTDGSNKIYNIHFHEVSKGDTFLGNDKSATQSGYEIYSLFGKKDGILRKRHINFFHSREAALRSAERLKESKKQKGYYLKTTNSLCEIIPNKKNDQERSEIERKKELLFKALPQVEPEMTNSQKYRFSNLIE